MGARQIELTGQRACDPFVHAAQVGILNSPQNWTALLEWLAGRRGSRRHRR